MHFYGDLRTKNCSDKEEEEYGVQRCHVLLHLQNLCPFKNMCDGIMIAKENLVIRKQLRNI